MCFKICLFEVYISIFSIFTEVYNHHHNLIPEYLHHPQKKLYPIISPISALPPALVLGNH